MEILRAICYNKKKNCRRTIMKKKIGALLLCGMLSFTAIGCSGEKEAASTLSG